MIKFLCEGTEDYDLQTNLCTFCGKRNQTVLSKQEVFNTKHLRYNDFGVLVSVMRAGAVRHQSVFQQSDSHVA